MKADKNVPGHISKYFHKQKYGHCSRAESEIVFRISFKDRIPANYGNNKSRGKLCLFVCLYLLFYSLWFPIGSSALNQKDSDFTQADIRGCPRANLQL